MKLLVIVQDLRVSGTSQGILERSFLCKLRKCYPLAVIDVQYLKSHPSDDKLESLPIDHIHETVLNLKVPFLTKLLNKFYWRLFRVSLNELYKQKVYGATISRIAYDSYDYIFIRSTGLDCETILGSYNLPILKKAFITFNEPYPTFWCSGATIPLMELDFNRLKKMLVVIEQSKGCISTAFLARDMQFLYGSRKQFYTLPHQFSEEAFNFDDLQSLYVKKKKVAISYHGAIQFGRNLDEVLDVYEELINENPIFKDETEFFVRLKSSEINRLRVKFKDVENIQLLESVNFTTSYIEQKNVADINISLENGPIYCSVLLGKAPVLDFINKPFLSISPQRSEMRTEIKNEKFIATHNNRLEIKEKLTVLIEEAFKSIKQRDKIFGDYFSDENFKKMLDKVFLS